MMALRQTGWKPVGELLNLSISPGTEAVIELLRLEGYAYENRLSDDPKGNESFNNTVIRLMDEETVLHPWTSTYSRDSRELIVMFTHDADAVMFRLMYA
jgi:hypothetical protein